MENKSTVDGVVKKVMSSWYEVLVSSGVITCRPRGRFKIESQEVLAGDRVRVRLVDDGTGYIEEVLPRQNSLIRPPVANIDQAIVVFSVRDPQVDPILIDRVIVHAVMIKCSTVLVLNKTDLATAPEVDAMRVTYGGTGLPFFAVSARTGEGVDGLKGVLADKTSVFAGQSGVGKSRLLNALVPLAGRKTGEVSDKIRRGRHTTRHVEIIGLPDGGFLVDTPGFSLLDPPNVGKWELSSLFPEIRAVESECKFTDCLHRGEPGCAVKEMVARDEIPRSRYDNYLTLLSELEEMERHKY